MDSALFCIAIMASINGKPMGMDQIRHQFDTGGEGLPPAELARALTDIGLKAMPVTREYARLAQTALPAIAQTKNGEYLLLAKAGTNGVMIQQRGAARSEQMAQAAFEDLWSGHLVLVKPAASDTAQPGRKFGLSWFIKTAGKYRGILRDCMLASFFVQMFALLSPLVFMLIIDKVLNHNSLSTLDVLIFALVVVSIFEILLNGLRAYLLSHTASRIDLTLGVQLFRHMLALPLSYFETRRVGDTIARMRELDTVRQFITGSGLMLFLDLLFVVVFLAVMFLFSPFLTTIVLVVTPILFLSSFLITPLLRARLENKYTIGAENQSFLVETVSGIETVKSMAAEPRIQARWEERLATYVKSSFSGGYLSNITNQTTAFISKALVVTLLYLGAKEVLKGNLSVGQLIAFNMLSARVNAPILRLSQIWQEFQQMKVSVARIADILDSPAEPGFHPKRTALPPIKGEVRFEHVTFRYRPDGPEILSDISFAANPGEVVGIVGSTGSGKTTLIKLLQRLYVPEKGRILIDKADLALADASWLRRQIGTVVQDGVLFNSSIRDNIAMSDMSMPVEQVIEAATLAGAHDFIMGLPQGYDTLAGERGCLLSTGQRQRVAIARALASNPRLLILDEATSALDYESEMRVQQNMRRICAGRTVFIIAHRLSTVRHADRILTLESGRIIEDGTPEMLLSAQGRYAALHNIQEGRIAQAAG